MTSNPRPSACLRHPWSTSSVSTIDVNFLSRWGRPAGFQCWHCGHCSSSQQVVSHWLSLSLVLMVNASRSLVVSCCVAVGAVWTCIGASFASCSAGVAAHHVFCSMVTNQHAGSGNLLNAVCVRFPPGLFVFYFTVRSYCASPLRYKLLVLI